MKFPPFLLPGDHVAIISPSGKIERQIAERGAEILRNLGFQIHFGSHTFDEDGIFAGPDVIRAADMQQALDDRRIKAIFFSRGGYGSIRTHCLLNWSSFFKKPKWLIGFSDITVFHAFLSKHKIASIHGVMTAWFEQDGKLTESFTEMMELLHGKSPHYSVKPNQYNRTGSASGALCGGNLSIIQSLRGTSLDIDPKGKILFIEDIGEYHYHIDRMMQNLKTGKILEKISGLIIGYFTAITDRETPYGKSSSMIIREAVETYQYPVIFGFPSGHELPNMPLILGSKIQLKVTKEEVVIQTV